MAVSSARSTDARVAREPSSELAARVMRVLTLALTLLALALVDRAHASASKVMCDRTVAAGDDIARRTTIMGANVLTGTNVVTSSASTYGAGETLALTLSGIHHGAFVHATRGTIGALVEFSRTTCPDGESLQKRASGSVSSYATTWTAPVNVSDVASVEITVGSAGGYGQAVTMQTITLTRSSSSTPVPATSASSVAAATSAVVIAALVGSIA